MRFKREDGTDYPEWESGTIGDYYVFKNGLNKEKAAFGQGTPIINYTDVFKNRLLTAKIIKGRVTLNEKEIENHNAMYGDVFLTRTSETLDEVGFCGALIEEIQDCVFSGFLLRGRLKDSTSIFPHFAGYYFMTKPIREEIISKSSITTRALPNGRNLSAVNVRMPHIEEQQKIAVFLSAVDEVIAQSEAEVQNLEQQKKAAMQKIYSQEVRFKREDGTDYPEWEEKAITDLCEDIVGGSTPSTDNKAYWSGDIVWVSSSDLENNNIHHLSMTRFITENAITNSATKRIPYNSILIVSRVGVGKVAIAPCELCTSQDFTNLVNPICNPIFLGYLLSLTMQIKANGVQGTSIKGVTAKEIKQYYLSIPHIEEQQKIADFLSAYDEAINYAKQELDKWKELKKGLL